MADVYIVNLKDNRKNYDKNDDIKFETCMRNKIISIGWGSEKSRENPNFKAAINNLNRMKIIWRPQRTVLLMISVQQEK